MWILPKNLHTSAFVPDMEALILDYNVLSEMSEQSLMSRSKPLRSRTWLQRWKKGILNQHLYGRTLKPSHGGSFLKKWTSSLEASLANPSHVQGKGKAQTTRATSSPTSSQELALFDLRSFSSKTSRASSAKSSAKAGTIQKEHPFCSMSLENWKDWVTEQRQYRRQRQKLALHTNATDGSSSEWPTSRTSDAEGGPIQTVFRNGCFKSLRKKRGQMIGAKLRDAVESLQNWPTIAVNESKNSAGKSQVNRNSLPLGTAVLVSGLQDQTSLNTAGNLQESWSTPNTMDGMSLRCSSEALKRQANTSRKGRARPANLREQVDPESCEIYKEASRSRQMIEARNSKDYHVQSGGSKTLKLGSQVRQGKLNPRWVETLMDLPVGWCMPSCNELSDIGYTHDFYYRKNDNRIDELRLLGNGVVPATAELAFKLAIQSLFQLYQLAA